MKSVLSIRNLLFAFVFLFGSGNIHAQALSGTYTLPGTVNSTTVNNLTQLATLLSTATVNGNVIFEFTSSYTTSGETFPITFTPFSGTGSVYIRPASSVASTLTTSGAPSAVALIDFSGVDNLNFDGRPGGTGTSLMWQFQNTGSSNAYPTFRFINGATNNTLKYLTIQASGSSSAQTILFSTSTITGGNSNNTIQNCNIGNYSAAPFTVIYSNGTAGANANSNNSILNNNIYNFQGFSSGPPTNGGVVISSTGNGNGWNISDNSFYSSVTTSQFTSFLTPIYFGPGSSSTGNTISGNYIGGRAAQGGIAGDPWIFGGYRGFTSYCDFTGIYVNAGAVTVSGNTIQNIRLNGSTSQKFCGIAIGGSTPAVVKSNTIGSPTTANSIQEGGLGVVVGIWNQSTAAVTIDGNTIANLTSDASSPPTSWTYGDVIGIYSYNSGAIVGSNTIVNNNIFSLTTANNSNINQYFPINSGGGSNAGAVYNMVTQQGIMAGIYLETASNQNQVISKNTVYDLRSTITGGTSRSYIHGIAAEGGAGANILINGNLIYNLSASDNYGGATYFTGFTGIYLPSGFAASYNVCNNIIRLGYRADGSSVQNGIFSGIWDNASSNLATIKLRIYHNSVFIGGTDNNTKSNNLNSYAFRRELSFSSSAYDSLTIRNNIFVNRRNTTAGTGKNYGMVLNSSINASTDYDNVFGDGTGFIYGSVGGTAYATLPAFKLGAPGFETNGISADPNFISPTTSTPDLHVQAPTPVDQAGTASYTTTYDFDSLIRANSTPVDIGATVIGNCVSTVVPTIGINASQTSICSGISVTFTASATNGGNTPSFNFYRNGSSVQNGSSNTYTTTGLMNNDSIWVVLTSSEPCASPLTATSSKVKMTVTTSVTPTATLNVSQNNICAGTNVTFTGGGTNLGTTPTYNFYRNGASVQNNSTNTYASSALNQNDSVWVIITSNATCATTTTATSAKIKMVVNQPLTPTVSLGVSQNNICAGTGVTFTATGMNGGSTPSYQFYRNGNSVQNGNSNIYALGTPANNDSVWVVMTSNYACPSTPTATSPKTKMAIKQPTYYTQNTGICQGNSYFFNGINRTTTGVYLDTLTGSNGCDSFVTLNLTVSGVITTTINQSICPGESYNFIGRPLFSAGVYYDTLTATGGCDSIIQLNLTMKTKPTPVIALSGNDTLQTGTFTSYQWVKDGVAISGATSQTYIATQNGSYRVYVTNNEGCGDTSGAVNLISVGISESIAENAIRIYPNPTSGLLHLSMDGSIQGVQYKLYDVYGRVYLIGESREMNSELDLSGLASGTYLIEIQSEKGSVTKRIEVIR